jgi:hypothetical protein
MRSRNTVLAVAAVASIVAGSGNAVLAQSRSHRTNAAAEAELRALVAQLNQLTADEHRRQQVVLPRGCAPFGPPFIAANVRSAIPTNPSCQVPAEKAYIRRWVAGVQNGMIVGQGIHNCEMRREAQPYDRNGNPNRGWTWLPSGPVLTPCR